MSKTKVQPLLFEPLQLRSLNIPHRLWVAPMCQFSTDGTGVPHAWHLVHLGKFATGRAGLVTAEATSVSPEGRISPEDTGIWNDEQVDGWKPITAFIREQGIPAVLQISHAGRKASMGSRFERSGPVTEEEGGWTPVAPSAIPNGNLPVPRSLETSEVEDLVMKFGEAANRAVRAGFDAVEIHAAHGYLIHEFLSPLSNKRTDAYGGDMSGRTKFLYDVVQEVRGVIPDSMPLFVRLSATEWVEGGWDIGDTVQIIPDLERLGVDFFPSLRAVTTPGRIFPFALVIRCRSRER